MENNRETQSLEIRIERLTEKQKSPPQAEGALTVLIAFLFPVSLLGANQADEKDSA